MMVQSPGRRLGRRQAREGIERIAEPRHGTATQGADEPPQAAGSGLMGVRMGYGDIDLWALWSRGARDRTGADVDLQRHGSGGISATLAQWNMGQAAAQVTPLDRAGGTIVVPVYLDGREIARATLPHQAREMQLRGVTS